MSFQMIHMEIAYRLLEYFPEMKHPAEFILGSVAPDSVHMNPEYDVCMKVRSHMFEGCGPWSDTQDYRRWDSNIYQLFQKAVSENGEYKDFLLGMCVHCLTDYRNDLKIWKKLQKDYIPPMTLEEFRTAYYPEAKGIDQWLYQNSKNTRLIREWLRCANAFSVDGLIVKEELEKQREHLLHVQYSGTGEDISRYQFLSAEVLEDFIDSVVKEITATIQSWCAR